MSRSPSPKPKGAAPVSHSERLKAERDAAKAANVAREAALAFLEADANGDGVLDWDEV